MFRQRPLLATSAMMFLLLLSLLEYPSAVLALSSGVQPDHQRVFVSTPSSKFPKKLVQDFMIPAPFTVTPDTPIDEALQLFLQHGIAGAPVVVWPSNQNSNDDAGSSPLPQLVGMLSSFDFLQQEAFEGSLLPMEGSQETVTRYVHAAQRICGSTVADVMTTGKTALPNDENDAMSRTLADGGIIHAVQATTPMRQAAALMTQHKLHRLPVVAPTNEHDLDDNDEQALFLVGMLTAEHVLQDLAHLMESLPPAPEEEAASEDSDAAGTEKLAP